VVNSIVNFSSESGLPDAPKASGIFFVRSKYANFPNPAASVHLGGLKGTLA
jgi:hypothetical protein